MLEAFRQVQTHAPATDRDIRRLLGPADDDMLMAIRDTGASRDEVRQAFAWLDEDDYIGAMLEKPMNHRIRRVYDILRDEMERNARYEH